jgi:hypothetical protein
MDVAHDNEIPEDIELNDVGEVIATRFAMVHYADQERGANVALCAYSPATGERYSATPGDYFYNEELEHLLDVEGNSMVLALVHPERVEPIAPSVESAGPMAHTEPACDHCHGGWELIDDRTDGELYAPCQHCEAGSRARFMVDNS